MLQGPEITRELNFPTANQSCEPKRYALQNVFSREGCTGSARRCWCFYTGSTKKW